MQRCSQSPHVCHLTDPQLATREAQAEEERKANEAQEEPVGHWKMDVTKAQEQQLKNQATLRDINQVSTGSTQF